MAASKEAPGDLAIVRAFVNTLDLESGTDELADPASLGAWLAARGLLDPKVTPGEDDARRARELREALRELLLANNDGHPVPEAAAVVDEIAGRASLRLRVGPDGVARLWAEGEGVDRSLGRLLVIVYRSMEAGTWPRLKVCRSDTCRWAFYDQSKNRSGHWCSMAVCGSQHKAREYRRRRSRAAHDAHA